MELLDSSCAYRTQPLRDFISQLDDILSCSNQDLPRRKRATNAYYRGQVRLKYTSLPRKDKTHYRHREEEVAFAHCHRTIQRLEYIDGRAEMTYV